MPLTMQDIVNRARSPLNDDAKTRHTDVKLLEYANRWITLARQTRPDLFIGLFSALPENLALVDNFPLPAEYENTCEDFTTARAELRGSEAEIESRAMAFLQLSASEAS